MYTYPTDRDIAASRGLNLPEYERDACGIGFLCNVDGHPDHEIVRNGYRILVNLTHRGACGCDPETGDGCGMLMQLPHALFQREAEAMGFALPAPGAYGAGMVFLPQDAASRGRASPGSTGPSRTRVRCCWAGATCRATTACSGGWPGATSR